MVDVRNTYGLIPVTIGQQETFPIAELVLLQRIEKLPEIFVSIILASFGSFIYGSFKFIGIQRLQKIVKAIELESLYRIFIVCGGEYDWNGCRSIFKRFKTQAVSKADIRKDEVYCFA